MAKRINVLDLVFSKHKNKNDDEFAVLNYQFKDKSNHMYEIKFVETGAIQLASRNQILKGTVIDLEKRKKLKRIQVELQLKERNRLVKKATVNYNLSNLSNKNVLSIEASTKSTGVAYAEKGVIKRSKVIVANGDCYKQRIFEMAKEIMAIMSSGKIEIVIIESTFLGLNSKILEMLSMLRGAIMYHVLENGAELVEIPPVKWKHFYKDMPVGRKEQKEYSIKKASELVNEIVTTDDEADAICMLYACLNMENKRITG